MTAYLGLLDALGQRPDATREGVRPLEVSLKLSALGQALDRDGEKVALAHAHRICERAERTGAWVTLDAEDHTTTDSTLSIAAELRTDFPWLGVVLQAYLRRTLGDCEQFAASGARVRLCKGAYDEPAIGGASGCRGGYRRLPALSAGADGRAGVSDGGLA